MKKLSYLWTLLLALMVGVSFVSCDDDDEETLVHLKSY